MLKKKVNKTIENISKRKLSIQFSLDGFSFCASNHLGEIYSFSSYQFESTPMSPESILNKIKEVFNTEKILQDDFESVFVIHQNTLNTLVPNIYFSENDIKNYLKFTVKTIATDLIVYDSLDDMKNVYIPYVNINNFLFQNFGEFEYKHHATVLIEKLLKRNREEGFYVNVNFSSLDIVYIKDNSLEFYNSFEFETKEDFIYYILFAMEQLALDPNEISLVLMGEIDEDSELYSMLFTYVRNIDFLQTNIPFLLTSPELQNHAHFTLLD